VENSVFLEVGVHLGDEPGDVPTAARNERLVWRGELGEFSAQISGQVNVDKEGMMVRVVLLVEKVYSGGCDEGGEFGRQSAIIQALSASYVCRHHRVFAMLEFVGVKQVELCADGREQIRVFAELLVKVTGKHNDFLI
jgi:hypothetical protein